METELVQVDAFTETPFRGNPAAVCLLDRERETSWMQDVAREMNLSETAFLVPRADGGYDLRWFTPAMEVDLCGHATLASAHVLWQDGHLGAGDAARFHTLSGPLGARRLDDGRIAMDFPAERARAMVPPEGFLEALGIAAETLWVGKNRMDTLVELAHAADVRAAEPDFGRLRAYGRRGVMITARADDHDPGSRGHDFISRFFAPAGGVDEDPVTGSAHCCLGPYWAEKLGREVVRGYQASARGGTVEVRVRGERVDLVGRAVTVLRARLLC